MKQHAVKNKSADIVLQAHQEQYIAPIPPPEMLAGYKIIDPTFADRIMKMAEAQNAAAIEENKNIIEKTFAAKKYGQIFSFVLALIGFALAAAFGFLKSDTGTAITSLIVSVVPIATATIKGMLKD